MQQNFDYGIPTIPASLPVTACQAATCAKAAIRGNAPWLSLRPKPIMEERGRRSREQSFAGVSWQRRRAHLDRCWPPCRQVHSDVRPNAAVAAPISNFYARSPRVRLPAAGRKVIRIKAADPPVPTRHMSEGRKATDVGKNNYGHGRHTHRGAGRGASGGQRSAVRADVRHDQVPVAKSTVCGTPGCARRQQSIAWTMPGRSPMARAVRPSSRYSHAASGFSASALRVQRIACCGRPAARCAVAIPMKQLLRGQAGPLSSNDREKSAMAWSGSSPRPRLAKPWRSQAHAEVGSIAKARVARVWPSSGSADIEAAIARAVITSGS